MIIIVCIMVDNQRGRYLSCIVRKLSKKSPYFVIIELIFFASTNSFCYDYFTGLTIHSKRLKSESTRNIAKFLKIAAIEKVFPDVPHCLCHYHFYKFVFDAPKRLDSNLMLILGAKIFDN